MSDGIGCKCAARSESECCCEGVSWEPKEIQTARFTIAAQQQKIAALDAENKAIRTLMNPYNQAATRLDEQTVTINELRRQHGVLMDALHLALPFVEDCERDPCYKAGAVAKAVASIKAAIATRRG